MASLDDLKKRIASVKSTQKNYKSYEDGSGGKT
jgi:hypothetical protein